MPPVRLSNHARKSYERLARANQTLFRRLDAALDRLAKEPGIGKPLAGPLAGLRSHRVGQMRIVYRVTDGVEGTPQAVQVLDIADRGSAYR